MLKDSPETVEAMRRVCRSLYEKKYTKEICTAQYVSLFRALLGQEGESST